MVVNLFSDTSSTNIYYFFSEKASEIYNVLSKRIPSISVNNCHSESVKVTTTVHLSSPSIQSQRSNLIQRLPRKFSEDVTNMKHRVNTEDNMNLQKIRSLEDISEVFHEVSLRNANILLEESEEEAAIIRRLKNQSTISRFNFSSDDLMISKHPTSPVLSLNRRKSSSDSTLTSIRMSYAEESQRTSMISESSKSERSSGEYEDKHHNFHQFNAATPISCKWQLGKKMFQAFPANSKHAERPLSVYSSTSQTSRDSGVMLSQSDECSSFQMGLYKNANDKNERDFRMSMLSTRGEDNHPQYRKFTDFIEESNHELSQQDQSQRHSTSSDSTLYSEIDGIPDCKHELDDPIYEDLDKFRKDIHKLLGIPLHCAQTTTSNRVSPMDLPPPLPPRKYKNRTLAMMNNSEVRRKDVMKYLGVDKDKFYGSLDKLHIVGSSSESNGSAKRKDIYRFLGIPSMAVSQPAGLNKPELMYDCPPAARRLKNKENEDVVIPQRRGSKTYVRIRPRIPSQGSVKEVKKRRMGFLKRKTSSASICSVEDVANSTYVSYKQGINEDLDVNEGSGNENKRDSCQTVANDSASSSNDFRKESNDNIDSHQHSIQDLEFLRASQSSVGTSQSSRLTDSPVFSGYADWEQYSEPASCRNSTNSFQIYRNVIEINQPYYENMSELGLMLNSITEDRTSITPFGSDPNKLDVKSDDLNYIRDMSGSPFCTNGINDIIQEEESSGESSDSDYLDMRGTIKRREKKDVEVNSNHYPESRNSDYMSMNFPSTSNNKCFENAKEEFKDEEGVNLKVEENEDNRNLEVVTNEKSDSNGLLVCTDQTNDDNLRSFAVRISDEVNDKCGDGGDDDALKRESSLRITEISHPIEETSKYNNDKDNTDRSDDSTCIVVSDVGSKSHVPYHENNMKYVDENAFQKSNQVLSQDSGLQLGSGNVFEDDKDGQINVTGSTDVLQPNSSNDFIIIETEKSDETGSMIRQRISSYIDEIFEQSVMEFENQLLKQCESQKSFKSEISIANLDLVNTTLELSNTKHEYQVKCLEQNKLQPISESEDHSVKED